jgi:hypothetical protein
MNRRAAKIYPEEMPRRSPDPQGSHENERKRQLAQILEHQGRIELDLDQETLEQLRASR